jgi:hypothetical protein
MPNRLVLLALDWELDEPIREALYRWADVGLLGSVEVVPLGEDREDFSAIRPADGQVRDLDHALREQLLREVVLVSVRSSPLSRVPIDRVDSESALQRLLRSTFPDGEGVSVTTYTLSTVSGEPFGSRSLPDSFNAHFLHDDMVYVGRGLARGKDDDDSRPLSMAFEAVLGAGGFPSQPTVPFDAVAFRDAGAKAMKVVRPVRGLARAASAGWMFDDMLRRVMEANDHVMPANVVNAQFDEGSTQVIDKLVDQMATMARFKFEDEHQEYQEPKRVGLLASLKSFLKEMPAFVALAAKSEVTGFISGLRRQVVGQVEDVLYGDDSSVVIRGGTRDHALAERRLIAEATRLSAEAEAGLATLVESAQSDGRVTEHPEYLPTPTPETWDRLAQTVAASLDGSDPPVEITALMSNYRLLFSRPGIVAPRLEASVFQLREGERDLLKLPGTEKFRGADVLDPDSMSRVKEAIRVARRESVMVAPPSGDGENAVSGAQVVRGTLKRALEEASRAKENPPRDLNRLESDFAEWSRSAQETADPTVLMRLSKHLWSGRDRAQAVLEECKSELKQMRDELDSVRKPAKRKFILRVLAQVLILGLAVLVVFVSSPMFGVAIGALAITALVLWSAASWLIGNLLLFIRRVFKAALRLRRESFRNRDRETRLQWLARRIRKARREDLRLRSLSEQLAVWTQVWRAVLHDPFGSRLKVDQGVDAFVEVPRPQQFSIATVAPNDEQRLMLRNSIQQRVFIKGYLSELMRGVRGDWRSIYERLRPGSVADPGSDHQSSWGQRTGYADAYDRPVYSPLQDFWTRVIEGDLRGRYSETILRDTVGELRNREVQDVFARIDRVDAGHRALASFTPDAYLFRYLEDSMKEHVDFTPQLFSIEVPAGRQLRESNVDTDLRSLSDISRRTLGDFDLLSGRQLVLLTYMVEVGKPTPLNALVGFQAEKSA